MSAVTFHAGTHVYKVEGREVPSVTTILKDSGMVSYDFCSEEARERGSLAHEAIHFAMEDDLDEAALHPLLVGYVTAARQVVRDLKATIIAVERRVYSPTYHYAGTLDLLFAVDGKRTLLDWKTGTPPPATALQLAAYADAWYEETGSLVSHRMAAQLHQDGRYTLHPYADRHDIVRFRAAVTVAQWRKEHGLL